MKYILALFLLAATGAQAQSRKSPSTPERDFQTFWKTFRDKYPFFSLKGVSWDSVYRRYRPLVGPRTRRDSLLTLLGRMAEPLRDGHITIADGDRTVFKGRKPGRFRSAFAGRETVFWAMVDNTLADSGFTKPAAVGPLFRGEALYYAGRSAEVGYIRITRCFGNPESLYDDGAEAADTKEMLRLFDSLLMAFADTRALIIDLRGNGGGHGGFELAARLAPERRLTHYKAHRAGGGYDALTAPMPVYIEPAKELRYLKPVYLLTSDRTASSAEDFTLSLGGFPGCTVVGTHTSGMFSDMLEAKLSGGVTFTLSYEVYTLPDGTMLEDRGVLPDIDVANSAADLDAGADPVLRAAMGALRRRMLPR